MVNLEVFDENLEKSLDIIDRIKRVRRLYGLDDIGIPYGAGSINFTNQQKQDMKNVVLNLIDILKTKADNMINALS